MDYKDMGYKEGSSKAMIERGELKLYKVKYWMPHGTRYKGHSELFRGEMTFFRHGEDVPSEDSIRFEMQLQGEHTRAVIDALSFGEPYELSFHQVKVSDLSLHQFAIYMAEITGTGR